MFLSRFRNRQGVCVIGVAVLTAACSAAPEQAADDGAGVMTVSCMSPEDWTVETLPSIPFDYNLTRNSKGYNAKMAIDSFGSIHVVYQHSKAPYWQLAHIVRPSKGSWSTPEIFAKGDAFA